MPDIPKPDGPDVNIGPSILAVEWALAGIAAVVLALRWISVVFFLRRVSLADYLMLLAFICAVVQGALLTESYKWGLGRHFYYLTDVQRFHAMRLLFLLQGWGIASPMFGRISFSFFMLHIFGERKHNKFSAQWPFWFTIISQAIVNIATIILIYTQCGAHPQALWDPTVHAQCLSPQAQTNFSYFQCALNSATDLYLTVLPAMAMRGLNMNWAKKLVIIFLLSLSVLALAASLVKAYWIKELSDRGDFTWALVKLHYWAVAENYLVIIAASVPLLNALVHRKKGYGTGSASYKQSDAGRITVENTWSVRHDELEGCEAGDTVVQFVAVDAKEKVRLSTIPLAEDPRHSQGERLGSDAATE